MASTYTDAGIELIAIGEQANTWGQTTNTNWRLMEEMATGVVSISLNGTTSYNLTTTDGATSNGRHLVVQFTGSPGAAATVTVNPDDMQKVYFVDNSTDEPITLTQGSGGDVTVPVGTKKIVYCDGEGSSAKVADLTDNLSLSGQVDISTFKLNGSEVTATASELNTLDGITATTADLNVLDGITATTADLNVLDGITATTAELNVLDGFTGDAEGLNYAVGLVAVLKPEPVNPPNEATDVGETPTLDGGAYYSLYGKTHAASRFQVATDSAFSSIVYDSGEINATETHEVPEGNLSESTEHYWRVYYKDEDGVQSEFSDPFTFTTTAQFFDPTDPANIGQPYAGGYLVGVIDTVAGTINSQDDYQQGLRYALVAAPAEYRGGSGVTQAAGLPTGSLKWDDDASRGSEPGCFTRWNGLEATNTILAKIEADYEIFDFIRVLRTEYPAPAIDNGSDWYVPAMDELELIYRNLKPVTTENFVDTRTATFPGTNDNGFNPSSAPQSAAYTTSNPPQTNVAVFQTGNAQALDSSIYWSSTDADDTLATNDDFTAWLQGFAIDPEAGDQGNGSKTRSLELCPVRRVLL